MSCCARATEQLEKMLPWTPELFYAQYAFWTSLRPISPTLLGSIEMTDNKTQMALKYIFLVKLFEISGHITDKVWQHRTHNSPLLKAEKDTTGPGCWARLLRRSGYFVRKGRENMNSSRG
jgi:hypothetical protein